MKKGLSAYLDLLRIIAALAVFVEHLSYGKISGGFLWRLGGYGHSAVIVFFVLSGFVIAFTADQKEKTLLDFSAARFGRLYSVVFPALVLTWACDSIGMYHNLSAYYLEHEGNAAFKLSLGFLFLTQNWQKLPLLSDGSFWSLPYEFWYYQIFAAAYFLRGWWRISAVTVASLIAGPAILMLFPVWLFGAYAYRASKTVQMWNPRVVWYITGVLVLGAILASHPVNPLSPLLPAAYSPMDFLIGILLAVNIIAATKLDFALARWKDGLATLAGMTFALYLFHLPLLHLAAAYVPSTLASPVRGVLVGFFALSATYLLSFATEKQKRRWRVLFYWLFSQVKELARLGSVKPALRLE